MKLDVISAGAARAVVGAVAAQTGVAIEGAFGAVGAMREKFLAGEPCEVIVLTRAMLEELAAAGRIEGGTIVDLGRVRTGVAVRNGATHPDVATTSGLRDALLAADAIYVPDTVKSTAGRHVAQVLATLGIAAQTRDKLKEYPNGATAMRAMADAPGTAAGSGAIGCTQVSEILYTNGVALVGPLPATFELATVYSAAVCASAAGSQVAHQFVAQLTGESFRELRARAGFEA